MRAWWQVVGVGLCLGGVAFACGGSDADGSCETGSERCGCYANLTCDSGLMCLSELCVDEDDASGGSGGSGGSGSGGSGGSGSDSGGSSSDSGGSSSDSGGSGSDSGGSSSDVGGTGPTSAGGTGSSIGGSGPTSAGGTGSSVGGNAGASTNGGASGGSAGGAGGSQAGSAGSGADGGTGGSGGTGGPIEGNLIQNGDFSDGDAHWSVTWGTYDGVVSSTNGEYCVENPNYYYLTFTLGYPLDLADVFPIESGASYTLRYRVKGFAAYEVKIGQAVEPYAALASIIDTSAASSSYEVETQTLVGSSSDSQAGLALNGFLAVGEYLCFDDISLVQD